MNINRNSGKNPISGEKSVISAAPDRLIRFSGAVLAIGMLITLIAISPIITGISLTPAWWYASMASISIGLIGMVIGLVSAAKSRSRIISKHKSSKEQDFVR